MVFFANQARLLSPQSRDSVVTAGSMILFLDAWVSRTRNHVKDKNNARHHDSTPRFSPTIELGLGAAFGTMGCMQELLGTSWMQSGILNLAFGQSNL